MKIESLRKPIVIAGPCAAESYEQMMQSAQQALARDVTYHRGNLWKPRTEPGFEGEGLAGLPWIREIAQMGLNPATEVLRPGQAYFFVDEVIKHSNQNALIWIGSRNQDHQTQRDIADAVAGEPRAKLMLKNPMWYSKKHWLGMVGHVIDGGADPSQLILCHRGFAPGKTEDSNGYRNIPDYDMAADVKKETGLPVVGDPSHIGGSIEYVLREAEEILLSEHQGVRSDGIVIEVHPEPSQAKTDAKQQITWAIYDTHIAPLLKEDIVYAAAD